MEVHSCLDCLQFPHFLKTSGSQIMMCVCICKLASTVDPVSQDKSRYHKLFTVEIHSYIYVETKAL